ncbi:MAG: hypothetical protein E6G14_00875 [Actinobacteria bacterium]|nr:MAG: hypothetical protein E6G14_00875 [Actinomycetota bacterium]
MEHEFDRDDHHLRVLIERMQQEGHSERDIAAAVRAAARRIELEERRPTRRPSRLGLLGRRLITR